MRSLADPPRGRPSRIPTASADLTGQFLIAMPGLTDPNFHQTVTYVCEHGAQGALGLVINRPADLSFGELVQQLGLEVGDAARAARAVQAGGPVRPDACLILHRPLGQWKSTLQVAPDIGITGSMDLLEALAAGAGPAEALVCLGYAGWGAGQLEAEILENTWLTVAGDPRTLFEVPLEQRWRAAAAGLGVDIALLAPTAGHA